jgi:hypothetical protein
LISKLKKKMKIKPDVINFLSFSKSDELFREMASDSVDVLMNIELIFKNKLNLDKSFHERGCRFPLQHL